jgi:hypothetical protein
MSAENHDIGNKEDLNEFDSDRDRDGEKEPKDVIKIPHLTPTTRSLPEAGLTCLGDSIASATREDLNRPFFKLASKTSTPISEHLPGSRASELARELSPGSTVVSQGGDKPLTSMSTLVDCPSATQKNESLASETESYPSFTVSTLSLLEEHQHDSVNTPPTQKQDDTLSTLSASKSSVRKGRVFHTTKLTGTKDNDISKCLS